MKKLSMLKGLDLALGSAFLVLTTSSISAADIRQLEAGSDVSPTVEELKSDPSTGRSLAVRGEFVTAIQVLPPFPSFPPDPFQPILHLLITATGNLTHFGKTTAATTDEAVDLSVSPNKGTGHWVFQNTRGDALWTEMDLTSTPPDADGRTNFRGTLKVIGGSGRFDGATGTLLGEGVAQGNAGSFSITGMVCVTGGDDDE
jgi:hypothetical protein